MKLLVFSNSANFIIFIALETHISEGQSPSFINNIKITRNQSFLNKLPN